MSKEDLIIAFEDKANELGMCLDQKWGDYEKPYTNPDTFLAYDLFKSGAKSRQQEIELLKAQLAQYQSDDYVLVPKVPSEAMIKAGEFYQADWFVSVAPIYKAMIEAQEQHNAKP